MSVTLLVNWQQQAPCQGRAPKVAMPSKTIWVLPFHWASFDADNAPCDAGLPHKICVSDCEWWFWFDDTCSRFDDTCSSAFAGSLPNDPWTGFHVKLSVNRLYLFAIGSSHKRSIGKRRGMGLQVPVQLVSPRCFPCNCAKNVGSAGQQISSCNLAVVLRQTQARRTTGSLFFCIWKYV